jgi:hypothetical protein
MLGRQGTPIPEGRDQAGRYHVWGLAERLKERRRPGDAWSGILRPGFNLYESINKMTILPRDLREDICHIPGAEP